MNDEVLHPGEVYRTAKLVLHVHEYTVCINCSPNGCTALIWAVGHVAKVAAARLRASAAPLLLCGAQLPPGGSAAHLRARAITLGGLR